ncbi:uncharacterized protein DEA37_0013224 [Paragonimus westermani]|uniref:GAT domain-containing protein n=1 Tax=Paragonimus westermani TaxID=34504 RepID=A0A5J4NNH5_9TREM|nr:uncharacterized protein DEA37_0013224 [Paragonimus westermani]
MHGQSFTTASKRAMRASPSENSNAPSGTYGSKHATCIPAARRTGSYSGSSVTAINGRGQPCTACRTFCSRRSSGDHLSPSLVPIRAHHVGHHCVVALAPRVAQVNSPIAGRVEPCSMQHESTIPPLRTVPSSQQMISLQTGGRPCLSSNPTELTDQMEFDADGAVSHLTADQRVKLTQDLSVVETNVNVLNDMLAELRPDTVTPDDLTLLRELSQTCRAMHGRVVQFLSQVSDEEVTPSLLQVNDNLNNAFMRYDRFERYRVRALRSEVNDTAAIDLAVVRSNSVGCHHVNRTTSRVQPMLAITAGTDQETTQVGRRLVPLASTPRNGLDDDDDLLIDISEELNDGATSRTLDMDEVARWLAGRQLVPVSQSNSGPVHSEQPLITLEPVNKAMEALALVHVTQPPPWQRVTLHPCTRESQRTSGLSPDAGVSLILPKRPLTRYFLTWLFGIGRSKPNELLLTDLEELLHADFKS